MDSVSTYDIGKGKQGLVIGYSFLFSFCCALRCAILNDQLMGIVWCSPRDGETGTLYVGKGYSIFFLLLLFELPFPFKLLFLSELPFPFKLPFLLSYRFSDYHFPISFPKSYPTHSEYIPTHHPISAYSLTHLLPYTLMSSV